MPCSALAESKQRCAPEIIKLGKEWAHFWPEFFEIIILKIKHFMMNLEENYKSLVLTIKLYRTVSYDVSHTLQQLHGFIEYIRVVILFGEPK